MFDDFFQHRTHRDVSKPSQCHTGVTGDAGSRQVRPVRNNVEVPNFGELFEALVEFEIIEGDFRNP